MIPRAGGFLGAIHGQYLQNATVPLYLRTVGAPYRLPSSSQLWDQCQHQTWFFAPWHRGYLLALEAQIRADVIKLGGLSTWSLPY